MPARARTVCSRAGVIISACADPFSYAAHAKSTAGTGPAADVGCQNVSGRFTYIHAQSDRRPLIIINAIIARSFVRYTSHHLSDVCVNDTQQHAPQTRRDPHLIYVSLTAVAAELQKALQLCVHSLCVRFIYMYF